jgi:hypothetical protein
LYIFDRALTNGAVTDASTRFIAANPAEAVLWALTVTGTVALTPMAVRILRSEKAKRLKQKHVRERLGLSSKPDHGVKKETT